MRRSGVAAALGGMLALALTAPAGAQQKAPAGFVSLKAEVPSIKVEMRYLTYHNFIGRPIRGYRDPLCIVTRETAEALFEAQTRVRRQGYTLKVYDCYRPQRSVDAFVKWGKDLSDQRMKAEFYPRVRKSRVFKEGYIATQSGHSRGSTMDLTLVKRPAGKQERYHRGDRLRDCGGPRRKRFRDNTIDMGTGYDCFDPLAHPYNARIKGKQRANRLKLRRAMLAEGFKGLDTEWWHFTLKAEPYPDTFFDFPVASAALTPAP
jgi:D-alanyl-D-alanine dipeptidase